MQINHLFDSYDDENKEIVKVGCNFLRFNHQINIPESNVETAFKNKSIPCRFQRVPDTQKKGFLGEVFLDVGHNPHAVEGVLKRFQTEVDPDLVNLTLVFGCKQQKDSTEIFKTLDGRNVGKVVIVTSKKKRELMVDPKSLLESGKKFQHLNLALEDENGDIGSTLEKLVKSSLPGKHLIVMGSFNLMFEARAFFGYQDY